MALRCGGLLVVALLVAVPSLFGQTLDSLAWERRLGAEGEPADTVAAVARQMLLGYLRSEDDEALAGLMAFMDDRLGVGSSSDTPWLEPRERLMVEIARAHPDTVATEKVGSLLEAAVLQPYIRRSLQDRFTLDLADYLLHYTPRMTLRLKERGASSVQQEFHLLLVNRFSTTGIRARAEVNRQIERFITSNSSSPLAALARRWLVTPYRESDLGGAIAVGWEQGGWSGPIADRLSGASGPSIELEGYIDQVTVVAGFAGATVDVPNGFVTRGDSIAPGTLGVQWARAMIGYEFRIGRTAFLPLAGVAAVGSAREAEEGEEIEGGATWSAGAQIGYRILPADVGPHIDLRLRVGATGAGLALDDPALAGVRWSVQIGVAVVARPIVVIP